MKTTRDIIRQQMTGHPVKFELTEQTRGSVDEYLRSVDRGSQDWLVSGRGAPANHLTTRQYARLMGQWFAAVGLDPTLFGTHALRRTKATLVHK